MKRKMPEYGLMLNKDELEAVMERLYDWEGYLNLVDAKRGERKQLNALKRKVKPLLKSANNDAKELSL